jgi:hypothetical protein
VGDGPIRQLVLYEKNFGSMGVWELNKEGLGSLWLMASATWGEITLTEGLHDWGRRAVPLLNYILAFALQLRKSTENLRQESRLNIRCADLAVFLGTASAGLLNIIHLCYTWVIQSALGRHKCLLSYRTKGFPASASFESQLSVSALMWSAKNVIPKSS